MHTTDIRSCSVRGAEFANLSTCRTSRSERSFLHRQFHRYTHPLVGPRGVSIHGVSFDDRYLKEGWKTNGTWMSTQARVEKSYSARENTKKSEGIYDEEFRVFRKAGKRTYSEIFKFVEMSTYSRDDRSDQPWEKILRKQEHVLGHLRNR